MEFLLLACIVYILSGMLCGLIGGVIMARHSFSEGFALGFLFQPIGILIAAVLALRPVPTDTTLALAQRPCPYCAEMILREAKVCRFCGRDVPALMSVVPLYINGSFVRCPLCHSKNDKTANRCEKCGIAFIEPVGKTEQSNRTRLGLVALLVIVLVGSVLAWYTFSGLLLLAPASQGPTNKAASGVATQQRLVSEISALTAAPSPADNEPRTATMVAAPATRLPAMTSTRSGAWGSINTNSNVRELPSTSSRIMGKLKTGDVVDLLARDREGQWLQIHYPLTSTKTNWVFAELVETSFEIQELPVIAVELPTSIP